jgi:predicted nuclease with TOPRIM domain
MGDKRKMTDKEKELQAEAIDYYRKQIAELKKENAVLKEKVNILDNCDRLGDMITEAYKGQLTKAKEIIKAFLDSSDLNIKHKAEEFLGEF